ncbi:universal stress protein [Nakamurella sp. GG22]
MIVAGSSVVVGVDGSEPSLTAAEWAAGQAARRHLPLLILHAYQVPFVGQPEYEFPPEVAESVRTRAAELLSDLVGSMARSHPAVECTTSLVEGDARSALVDVSRGAALTVVGSRGGGRLREVLLGSVALYVASHGRSPVAVVPAAGSPDGPVVVGVDGSHSSDAAVEFAFDEADARGADMVAVLAWDELAKQRFARRPVVRDPRDSTDDDAMLAEQLAGWHEKYPDVAVRRVLFKGQPAEAMLRFGDRDQHPAMLVVGSRGRGGFTGLLLGSTSQTVLTHATCPVVVVRHSSD